MATPTPEEFLRQYHDLDRFREEVQEAYDLANCGEGSYERADTLRFDLNELLADLADMAAAIFEADDTTTVDQADAYLRSVGIDPETIRQEK